MSNLSVHPASHEADHYELFSKKGYLASSICGLFCSILHLSLTHAFNYRWLHSITRDPMNPYNSQKGYQVSVKSIRYDATLRHLPNKGDNDSGRVMDDHQVLLTFVDLFLWEKQLWRIFLLLDTYIIPLWIWWPGRNINVTCLRTTAVSKTPLLFYRLPKSETSGMKLQITKLAWVYCFFHDVIN